VTYNKPVGGWIYPGRRRTVPNHGNFHSWCSFCASVSEAVWSRSGGKFCHLCSCGAADGFDVALRGGAVTEQTYGNAGLLAQLKGVGDARSVRGLRSDGNAERESQWISDCEENDLTDNIGEVAHSPGGRRGCTFPDLFRFKFFFTLNEQSAILVVQQMDGYLAFVPLQNRSL